MHMVSKKDLHSAELETMRISTVMTASGEVQTREEATVYVKKLDVFVTVMLLEETPAVLLPLGKSAKIMVVPTTGQKWQKNQLQHSELRTIRCPWSVHEFLYFIFTCFFNIFIEGNRKPHGASSNRKKLNDE